MNDATPEPRRCKVCGDPIRRHNKYGICADQTKPACRQAREQLRESTSPPQEKSCEVCGRPIRSDNETGICQRPDSPECRSARQSRNRKNPLGKARFCEVCGRRLRRDNAVGVCSGRGSDACSKERDRRRRSGSPARPDGWTPPPYMEADSVFGRLTVLEDVKRSQDPAHCRCECGTEKWIGRAVDLTIGDIRSCGCLRRDLMTTHGLHQHPLYATWNGIMGRTMNPDDVRYPNYGGRGIKISERWLDLRIFIEDIEQEIGPRPEGVTEAGWPLYTLDRIDVDGHYESGNVRWGTWTEQAINRRKIPKLTQERDALVAQVETLAAQLQALTEQMQMPRKPKMPIPAEEPLF